MSMTHAAAAAPDRNDPITVPYGEDYPEIRANV
jgi:hypothetical protein